MTGIQVFAALCAWFIATCIVCYLVFRYGYNLGWEERHKSMILPRNFTRELNNRLDLEARHDRHSAMDANKIF